MKRKRSSDDITNGTIDHDITPKRGKLGAEESSKDDDLIVVEDNGTGAIVIDDD